MSDLTIGSLFAGIGGLELGLERAGLGPVLWQAEQNPFCRRVLAKHWPDARRYQDVRAINERAERVDVICGGFPCQDISVAGSGDGIDGEKSGLWREFARIVRVQRPRFVVIENVPALRMRGLCRVLRDLAACGYDAEWDCVPASAVGAPHRRDRVYIIGILVDTDGQRRSEQCWSGAVRAQQSDVEHTGGSGWPPTPDDVHAWGGVPAGSKPSICRISDGIPDRAHRLRALGNSVVPAVAEVIGRVIMAGLQDDSSSPSRNDFLTR